MGEHNRRQMMTEKWENSLSAIVALSPARVGVGTLADANFCFIETTDFTDWHG